MGKTTWTFEMESQLALFYEKHTPMKEMCEWFHKKTWCHLFKSYVHGINTKVSKEQCQKLYCSLSKL